MPTERIVHKTACTIVVAVDEPDPNAGGACHCYQVLDTSGHLLVITFQRGPIGAGGAPGVTNVDLLAIVRDRMDFFQRGPFASPTNEVTAGFVGAAIASEETRTRRREFAGVEGINARAPGVED